MMMRSTILLGILALLAFHPSTTAWAAETAPAAEQTQGGETWDKIKAYTVEKKSEAVAYGKELLQETDARIAQLEAKAAKASGKARAEYDKQLHELRKTRARTAAKLEQMEKESGAAWSEAKQGFADAYKDLQHAYDKALKHFK